MANAKENAANKIKRNLFLSRSEFKDSFSELELERRNRIMLCVTTKMDDPIVSDRELVEFLVEGCGGLCKGVSQSSAYRVTFV